MSSPGEHLSLVFLRELESLRAELRAYPDPSALWISCEGLPNSAGTLALHLCGNLQHFVGAVLGVSGYVRDRDREFAARGLRLEEIESEINRAAEAVRETLPRLDASALARDYPAPFGEVTLPVITILARLLAHFGYHLGQIDYHRRTVTRRPSAVEHPPITTLLGPRPVGSE